MCQYAGGDRRLPAAAQAAQAGFSRSTTEHCPNCDGDQGNIQPHRGAAARPDLLCPDRGGHRRRSATIRQGRVRRLPRVWDILAHGFLRLRCGDCGHDKLLGLLAVTKQGEYSLRPEGNGSFRGLSRFFRVCFSETKGWRRRDPHLNVELERVVNRARRVIRSGSIISLGWDDIADTDAPCFII